MKTIFEDQYKDYNLKVKVKNNNNLSWYMNDIKIMEGLDWNECYQVTAAQLKGTDNKILVGGLGFGNTTKLASKYGEVITIEILQSVVDFFDYNNPNHKFKIIVDDFYDYVMNTNQRFDAILLQLDFPGVSSNAKYCLESNKRLYTKEFLSRIKDILNDEGVFVTEGLGKENDDLKDSHITKLFEELKFDPIEMWNRPFLPMDSIDHILWRCVNGPI